MSTQDDLERRYLHWLRAYPRQFRRERGGELLAVLMAGASDARRRPQLVEVLDLVAGGVRMRLRVGLPASARTLLFAVRCLVLAGLLDLVAAYVELASTPEVKANLLARYPGFSPIQWHELAGGVLRPDAIALVVSSAILVWLGWANGRRHRWARVVLLATFGLSTVGLLSALGSGAALFAPADLAASGASWAAQLAAVVFLIHPASSLQFRPAGASKLTREAEVWLSSR